MSNELLIAMAAKMLGLDMAPRPHKQQGDNSCDNTGMTFATAGSGIYSVPEGVPTLSDQLNTFENLINTGIIKPERLAKSVALVAISGNDYNRVGVALPSGFGDVSAFILNVTHAISDSVDRLTELGVPKVLVNNLHPVGCTPAQTKAGNHSACDAAGNTGAVTHNKNLAQRMDGKDGVLVVDLHSAFKGIVDHPDHKGSEYSSQFKFKLTPCCEGIDPKDFCADTSTDGILYSLCKNPKMHFYWDEMHPSQTGWAAIMAQVEGSIKQFVGIAQN
jgi:phospholipase/lecithinase/hemolysin